MDYAKYRIGKRVMLLYGFVGSACGVAVGYLFYRHWIAMVLFSGLGFLVAVRAGEIHERRKVQWNLLLEFKDAMDSMVSALVAGYSIGFRYSILVKENIHLLSEGSGAVRPSGMWSLKNIFIGRDVVSFDVFCHQVVKFCWYRDSLFSFGFVLIYQKPSG